MNIWSDQVETRCPIQIGVTNIVPYIHVANVARSIAFYETVGMVCRSRYGPEGQPYWASMASPVGQLMLGQADGVVDPRVQAVLFYLYTPDLLAMRKHLLEQGLADGGVYHGDSGDPFPISGAVYSVTYPPYLPQGEMRAHDPDGYVLQFATSRDAVQ